MEARACWLQTMLKIADPVLKNLAAGTLKQNMPMVFHPDRAEYMHLEALGRTVCGIAPWLELDDLTGEEAEIQAEYRELTRKAIANAVNPESPDFMNFTEGYGQALVDAAFLAHGIVRAPKHVHTAGCAVPDPWARHGPDAAQPCGNSGRIGHRRHAGAAGAGGPFGPLCPA